MTSPTDNLVRAVTRASTVDDDGRTLHGHFSVFDEWYEIDSWYEGRFLERFAPGAFRDTLGDTSSIKVLYDHGMDPELGNKPLGPILRAGEDDHGAFYEVRLSETSYNRDFIIPAARDGLLGASMRFSVVDEDWDKNPKRSAGNPDAIPERTITRAKVYEFGPVTFPANPAATAAVRSRTDDFADHLLKDPAFVARFTERVGPKTIHKILDDLKAGDAPPHVETPDPAGDASTRTGNQRRTLVRLHHIT